MFELIWETLNRKMLIILKMLRGCFEFMSQLDIHLIYIIYFFKLTFYFVFNNMTTCIFRQLLSLSILQLYVVLLHMIFRCYVHLIYIMDLNY